MSEFTKIKLFNKIDTVTGYCEYCNEQAIMVGIVQDFYRCTNCGEDTKQHINGRIRYMQLSESDIDSIKKYQNGKTEV